MAALVILAVGCSGAAGSGGVGPGLVGTDWRLVAIDGAAPPAGPDVTLRFEADRVSGEAPCNSYSGFYTQDVRRGRLAFGSMVSTKRACVDPARSRLETAWFAALTGEVIAGLDGDARLELTAGGVELSLDRIR
jgi:heat shock protein HslJ